MGKLDDFFEIDETEEEKKEREIRLEKDRIEKEKTQKREEEILNNIGYKEKPIVNCCLNCEWSFEFDPNRTPASCHGCGKTYFKLICKFINPFDENGNQANIRVSQDGICKYFMTKMGILVFGSFDNYYKWLNIENPVFNGMKPHDFLYSEDETKREFFEAELIRMDNGIFS